MRWSLISDNLVMTLSKLNPSTDFGAALAIVGHLTEPSPTLPGEPVALRAGDHELRSVLPSIASLAQVDAATVYGLMKARLITAMTLSSERVDRTSDWWRPAIEVEPDVPWMEEDALNFLVSGTRDVLREWIRSDPVAAGGEIRELVVSDSGVLERLGLWGLVEHPDLVNTGDSPAPTADTFFDVSTYHERMLLLSRRFGDMPPAVQDTVHSLIAEGPPGLVSESPGDKKHLKDAWRTRVLAVIPREYYTEDESRWWKEIDLESSVPADPLYLRSAPSFGTEERSADFDLSSSLAEGAEHAVRALRKAPYAWDQLREAVLRDPNGLLTLAPYFEEPDFPWLWHYFNAYSEAARQANMPFAWKPLVDLADRVVSARMPGDTQVLASLGWALHEGLRTSGSRIPDDLVPTVFLIAVQELEQDATPFSFDMPRDMTLDSYQLGSPAGVAASVFMACLWREVEARDPAGAEGMPLGADTWITNAIRNDFGGVEMRYALGQYAWLLDFCQPGWVAHNAASLTSEALPPLACDAFAIGYLHTEHLRADVMQALVGVYQGCIDQMQAKRGDTAAPGSMNGLMLGHIVSGWFHDVPGFSMSGLLGNLHEAASDEVRGEIARVILTRCKGQSVERRLEVWAKLDDYWSTAVHKYRREGHRKPSEELTWLCAWAEIGPAPLSALEDRLNLSVDHLTRAYGVAKLVEVLALRADKEPLPAIRLLARIARTWAYDSDVYWPGKKVGQALEAVSRAGGDRERQILAKAVDELLKARKGDFTALLEDRGTRMG